MKLNSLNDVYIHQLKDLYSAEKQILDAMPAMIGAASSPTLQKALRKHQDETQNHMETVRNLLRALDENPGSTVCKGMEGLITEAKDVIGTAGTATAKDVALIAAAQRVEHYEMAAYGSARAFAEELGYHDAVAQLQTNLNQEGEANEHLSRIAVGGEALNERVRAR